MLIDLFTCVIAFALERHEDWSLLWPLLLQRFYYRQMMYVVLFRAVKQAVQGGAVGWRGVEPEVPATCRVRTRPKAAIGDAGVSLLGLSKIRGCIPKQGNGTRRPHVSSAFDAGNGKITVPDILARKSPLVFFQLPPRARLFA